MVERVEDVGAGHVSDDMVHAALAAVDPMYRDHLRNPLNGPRTAERAELDIARTRKMLEAAFAQYFRCAQRLSSNERLRELVTAAGLSQPDALAIFNRGIGVRPISLSTWKGYFCAPGTRRFRTFSQDLLAHAERVFANLVPRA